MTHVDIVKNEWLAGYQVVIGRVILDGAALKLDAGDANAEALIKATIARFNGRTPADTLALLHAELQGDYVFATEAHDETNCPYQGQMVVPLRAEEVRARVPA